VPALTIELYKPSLPVMSGHDARLAQVPSVRVLPLMPNHRPFRQSCRSFLWCRIIWTKFAEPAAREQIDVPCAPEIQEMISQAKKAYDSLCDRFLGIRTADEFYPVDSSGHRDAQKCAALAYGAAAKFIKFLDLQTSDVVYDLGCGTGRVACLFARHSIAKCIGVELDPRAADIAKKNAIQLRGRRSEIAIIQADAASLDYGDGSVFWLYNPFGAATLAETLARIRHGARIAQRPVRFCYVTPENEQVFSSQDWLFRYQTIRSPIYPSCIASFWRSRT
jgi:ubiquinone/menaquinone biosynthesis C-methylase UbiE